MTDSFKIKFHIHVFPFLRIFTHIVTFLKVYYSKLIELFIPFIIAGYFFIVTSKEVIQTIELEYIWKITTTLTILL